MTTVLLIIHFILVVLLIVAVMLQKTGVDSLAGLGGGSVGGGPNVQHSTNALAKFTYILAVFFMLNCLLIGRLINDNYKKHNNITQDISKVQAADLEAPQLKE